MSVELEFTAECQGEDCEGTARHGLLDLSADLVEPIEIDIDMCCSQIVLTCDECGLKHYTSDIEIMTEDEL